MFRITAERGTMGDEPRPSFKELYEQKKNLQEELARLDAQLLPGTMDRLVRTAAQIPDFGEPEAAVLAGALLHSARCTDEAGHRLRRALGHTIVRPGDEAQTTNLRLVLVLWTEPSADDAQILRDLGLAPAFPEGRWRPCAAYVGQARPEALADLVLRLGGEVHALMREKKARGSRTDTAAS